MDENFIYRDHIGEYLQKNIKPHDGLLAEMEKFAQAKDSFIPIIDRASAAFLEVAVQLKRPKRVLEIGTAMGYSAILMCRASDSIEILHTIERYEKMVRIAAKYIARAKLEDKIYILKGDAKDILSTLGGKYDFIFLDGAKGQYPVFLPYLIDLLESGGLLICDDVLYKGMISSDELFVRRKVTIIKRLKKFMEDLMGDDRLSTAIIPVGDGMTMSVKK